MASASLPCPTLVYQKHIVDRILLLHGEFENMQMSQAPAHIGKSLDAFASLSKFNVQSVQNTICEKAKIHPWQTRTPQLFLTTC